MKAAPQTPSRPRFLDEPAQRIATEPAAFGALDLMPVLEIRRTALRAVE